MSKCQTIIPKEASPAAMPSGLQVLYTFDAFGHDGEKLTEAALKKLVRKIQRADNVSVFLCPSDDIETALEEEYFQVEIDDRWIALQYVVGDTSPDAYFCSCFDPDYLDSDEESPMVPGDGQSVILKKYTMHDPKLAADCVEYYARTGKLYPGMAWLKEA
ncbi:MAG: hypothetical protein K2O40_14865 [Lachnospiraceae bacterium]|nr:hypothetical protein [Lachnospiraceae bacterium]